MKHIKLFKEHKIEKREFPENGSKLNSREKQILLDLVGEIFLNCFRIRKEDNYYYTYDTSNYNKFDGFNELKDYILCKYYILYDDPISLLNLLKVKDLDPSFDNNCIIVFACTYGHTEIVKLLLKDPRVDPSVVINHAIRWASEKGHTEVVKLLLKDPRVDPSALDNYAIRYASINGHTEVVKLLLQDPRVDPAEYNNYSIRSAVRFEYLEIVKLLIKDPRVDPSDENNFAIHWASEYGYLEIVKLLIKDPRVRAKLKEEKIKEYEAY